MTPTILLQNLIRAQSITPLECGLYDLIMREFEEASKYFDTQILTQEKEGVKNLFMLFTPKGSYAKKPYHFCFAGHIDVVPAGEGWEYDPFCAQIIQESGEDSIYGRGAQDMKGGVSAFICALRDILLELKQNLKHPQHNSMPPIAFSILLTSDEEGDGIYGTRYMLQMLKEKNLLPDSCIVAEPTSIEHTGDMIKIGRRGSINGVLNILGKQGHVAYPQKCINPVELLGSKLGALAGVELDNGDRHFAPSKLVITDIRGGMQTSNVTPQNLKIMFNVRNSPLNNEASIRQYTESILGEIPHTLELKTSSTPFLTNSHSQLIKTLLDSIRTCTGIESELSTSGGTSDARFFASFGIDVVELGVPNDRIHAINERVKIRDLNTLYEIFVHFLRLNLQNAQHNIQGE